jgi:glyoxylase-like metal-dependent hydrolase (beta-lactamase superfamily II)
VKEVVVFSSVYYPAESACRMEKRIEIVKKLLRNTLIALACFAVLLSTILLYSFSRTLPLAQRRELSGGAVQVKDGMVSVAIIPSADRQVILVDCGSDSKARAILEGLGQMGLGKESVKAILLTHAHPDHIGGCGAFPAAEIFAMAAERSLLEGRAASRSLIGVLIGKKDSGLHIARYLQDGDSLQLGNVAVSCYLVPGHTDGSAAYLAAGTLYLGDSADSGRDGTLLPAKRFVSTDVGENRASLERLAEKLRPQAGQIKILEFAHSASLTGVEPLLDFARTSRSMPRP